jgi:hypothetical protein
VKINVGGFYFIGVGLVADAAQNTSPTAAQKPVTPSPCKSSREIATASAIIVNMVSWYSAAAIIAARQTPSPS